MGERANGLRGVSQLNASDLPMLVWTDPAASACRVCHTSRRSSLYRLNGDVFARLVNITPPLRSSKLTRLASGAAARRGLSPSLGGVCPRRFGVCPRRWAGPVPIAWRGLSPRGERTAYAVRTGQITAHFGSPRRGLSPSVFSHGGTKTRSPSAGSVPVAPLWSGK